MEPIEIIKASAWWHGPTFLRSNDPLSEGKYSQSGDNALEAKGTLTNCATVEQSITEGLLQKHSNLSKACRILAYCLRFLKARRPIATTTFISHIEINSALETMSRTVQKSSFPEEYKLLVSGRSIKANSKLLSLSPFIDKNGLIRVGGRLKHSSLNFDTCHPILLPRRCRLTERIIEHEHGRSAHAGVQATMATIRQRFWPIALRSTARRIIRGCITCFKARPISSETIMGQLPAGRVKVSRPFAHCGVDYAGPLMLKEGKRRNARNLKAYISIFVCFTSKAVHIELVSDLTSNAFLAALKRFISRRGKPSHIYSDNGSTFVGAYRQMKEFYEFFNKQQTQDDIANFLRAQETSWAFIPPNAPHFGGLWEAAVKSTKIHLYRIVGNSHLTFEEMITILCEIEAILNSRPITPLSEDPNDLTYLSPGHFLIGTPLNSFPYPNLTNVTENRLIRWQRVEQLRQHFWHRWSTEYLHSLQERHKWRISKGYQLKIGQLVLIRQQALSPLQWLLGRVEKVHSDSDGNVRSASLKTARRALL